MLGKKAKKIKRKAERAARKAADTLARSEHETAPSATDDRAGTELPPSAMAATVAMRTPDYDEDAQEAQRIPRKLRRKRSAIRKRTINAMHLEINRRQAAVGKRGTAIDPEVPDHEKFVTLGRLTGNVGDTLAGDNPEPSLIRHELIRVMALAAAWAQSIPERGRE
jgi:hypothetical protein